MSGIDYKSSGVDLDVYEESMRRVGKLVQSTATPGVMPLPGGFAGLFRLFSEGRQYKDPVIVSGTDGVGTKIKVAQLNESLRYDWDRSGCDVCERLPLHGSFATLLSRLCCNEPR